MAKSLRTYEVYWAPEGRKIAIVVASSERAAIRKAPQPYRKYLGELYVVDIGEAYFNRHPLSTKEEGK